MTSTDGRLKKTASKNEFTLAVYSHGPTISFLLAAINYEPSVKKSQASAKIDFVPMT